MVNKRGHHLVTGVAILWHMEQAQEKTSVSEATNLQISDHILGKTKPLNYA